MVEEAGMNDSGVSQKASDEKSPLSAQPPPEEKLSLSSPQIQPPTGLSPLQLNPTSRSRRRSGPNLTLKSICMLLALLVALAAARLHVQYDVRVLYRKYYLQSNPHISMFYRPAPGDVPRGDAFLRPLVGRRGELGGVFDVRATVWVRTQDEAQTGRGLPSPETVVFADTLFRGVTIQDKRLRDQVQLRIPMRLFQNTVLKETDLRASFVLIPQTPSLLDDAVDIRTINTEHIDGREPVRSYLPTYSPTLQDRIVDSYGVSTPLLGFYPMQVSCNNSVPGELDARTRLDGVAGGGVLEAAGNFVNSTAHSTVLQRHPHIIARTFLTVAEATGLYDTQRYDQLQGLLRKAKYRCQYEDLGPSVCTRNFPIHGVFETKFQYRNGDGPTLNEGWAYAPFMSVINNTWGPLDLIPAPVSSDACPPIEGTPPQPGSQHDSFIDVTWHITYSGRTPLKLAYTNGLSTPYNPTINAEEKIVMQSQTAGRQGILGHPYRDDEHPRRRAILEFIASKSAYVNTIVTLTYFNTLSTTAGLSTVGTTLRASLLLLNRVISEVVIAYHEGRGVYAFVRGVVVRVGSQMTALLMLKAVMRAGFEWDRRGVVKLIPHIRIYAPTRRERASMRLESRISWSMIIGAFCLLDLVLYLIPFHKLYIIHPRNMAAPRELLLFESYHLYIATHLLNPAETIATLLQLVHNYRSKTFAGNHKVAVGALVVSVLAQTASESPAVVGYMDVHPGYDVGSLMLLIWRLVIGFQAWRYPAVAQSDPEDKE